MRMNDRRAGKSAERQIQCLFAPLASLLLAGCAVGPNFERPAPPSVSTYAAEPLAATAATASVPGGEAQRFSSGADLQGDWWTLFHSLPLNTLIEQALANNPDLKAAQAALKAAQETTRAQRGVFFPSLSAGAEATRQLDSGSRYNVFTPQVSVSYVPDVFGLNRRTLESVKAQQEVVRYETVATQITLVSNVAAAAMQDASLSAQIDTTRRLVAINDQLLETLRYQHDKGYASPLDLAAQEAQAAEVAATLPPLLKAQAQNRNLLATLAGQFPGQTAAPDFNLDSLTLPQDLPVTLPSVLVAQRPDVLQAEANLHAANAQVGIAEATRLPNFELTANAGRTAGVIRDVFHSGAGFWSLGAAATTPIFQGGALLHQQRAAKANYTQAAEQYRSTVLTGVQNVADTLAALKQDADTLQAAATAEQAAKRAFDLSQEQWKVGYASYLTLLSAEQSYQEASITLIQARADRYLDTVALYQALGGGWWRRAELAKD
jgi:NodT family efflux transporter outer membrane factor (OMF) lipoprotein